MPELERIHKLQPNRTLALRGFDHLGASAALHSATADSFKVSGVFRDPADFAVLVLYDADNFYDHPRIKYLPDFTLGGLTLNFDVRYEGLMPLDSPKYATIDWPFLDAIKKDGTSVKVRLSDKAAVIGPPAGKASASFTIESNGMREFDRLTLWYLNLAFDYIVPKVTCSFEIFARGPGYVHTVTVGGSPSSYVELPDQSSAAVAQGIVEALSQSADVEAVRGNDTPELGPTHLVNIRNRREGGSPYTVTYLGSTESLHPVTASTVAAALADQVNSTDWRTSGALIRLEAACTNATLNLTAKESGIDGNMISMYAVSKNSRLRTTAEIATFTGGTSDATLRVTLDFAALGLSEVRLMWLTFAPPLANASAFTATEWLASFSNWTLTGPEDVRRFQVAGLQSVRVEENDSWCSYAGTWSLEHGFFSEGFARRASSAGDAVTVRYHCPAVHDLYIGTSLYTDRGIVNVSLDGGAPSPLDCFLANEPSVNTRRKVRSDVAPGQHTVTIQLQNSKYFYFDFLEAVVPSDVPPPLAAIPNLSPALDYSTDHTFKLPPARIHWNFDNLGFAGPMNEYIGVFWWNQRQLEGAEFPSITVTFSGAFASGDHVFLNIGGQEIVKTVFPGETPEIVARHFAFFINANFVGVWASASGAVLTIRSRSPQPAYSYTFSCRKVSPSASTGTLDFTGRLQDGVAGTWVVDPSQPLALNRGARDWHSDMFRECRSRNREIVVATSMELVNPPAGFGAVYWDGSVVATDVGFASMKSTHCTFVPDMLEFHKKVYTTIADLMAAEDLRPSLQFGEFLWWFFTSYNSSTRPNGSMAFYHPIVKTAAQAALGRPLARFNQPTDSPAINGSADAVFLRNRLRDYVNELIAEIRSRHPNARLELLFPYDVNHPEPAGVHNLGGALNRFVNMPVEWESKAASNLDAIKMEALDFGAWSRNLDLAKTAIRFPLDLGWPRDSVRHLVPVFRGGYPWEKEVAMAEAAGVQAINLWAFDHVCIYGWPSVGKSRGRAQMIG